MATFGQKLKERRGQRGLSLEQISEVTRVRVKHLEALECGDFDALPQDVFVKGFLRTYAEYIGADTEALVEEYLRERHGQVTGEADEGSDEIVQEMARGIGFSYERTAINLTPSARRYSCVLRKLAS